MEIRKEKKLHSVGVVEEEEEAAVAAVAAVVAAVGVGHVVVEAVVEAAVVTVAAGRAPILTPPNALLYRPLHLYPA